MADNETADGCQVDWSWLTGQEIVEASSDLENIAFRFASGLTLTVKAAQWQGKPFLAFDPYKAPQNDSLPTSPPAGGGTTGESSGSNPTPTPRRERADDPTPTLPAGGEEG